MLSIKNDGYKTKKVGVAVIIYYQFMVPQSLVCTVYVVKSPVLGLQRAPENSEFAPSVQFSLVQHTWIYLRFYALRNLYIYAESIPGMQGKTIYIFKFFAYICSICLYIKIDTTKTLNRTNMTFLTNYSCIGMYN